MPGKEMWCEHWNICITDVEAQAICLSRGMERRSVIVYTKDGRFRLPRRHLQQKNYIDSQFKTIKAKVFRICIRAFSLF